MIGVGLLAALLLLALAIYVTVRHKPAPEELRGNDQTEADNAIIAGPDSGDAAFDAAFAKHVAPHTDKYFSTRIAGASDPTADGSRRRAAIKQCEPMELLRLELDPNHPSIPRAGYRSQTGRWIATWLSRTQGSERPSSRCRRAGELVCHF